jgi:adenylate kinase
MAALASSLPLPNILVTGTPGTGKSATCARIAERTGFRHIEVSELVKQEGYHEGWDEEHQSYTLDEDRLLDALEEQLAAGACVVDFHSCELFPERWFELVLVLTADNTVLYDRLQARGYAESKVQENVQCEILEVILTEARDSYAEEIVHALKSETLEEMHANVQRVEHWLAAWRADHPSEAE